MRFSQKIIIVFLLLSIFAVGTQNFIEPVEAAKWTKYNSGKFTNECPEAGYKKVMTYHSYTNGSNNLYANIYSYSKKNNKKKLDMKLTFSKKNGIIKANCIDYSWNMESPEEFNTTMSVKAMYKSVLNGRIKDSAITPKKKSYNVQSFKVKKNTYKVYSIKNGDGSFSGIIYKNNEEYNTIMVYKYNNKVTFDKFNSKRVITSRKDFSVTKTTKSVYQSELKKIIKKLKK
ncbi:MAG: hypothetical protein FWH54_06490 [Methanobrevibacter sp.]|nr:hypothetical protein [Methanobrevibacter sp.]